MEDISIYKQFQTEQYQNGYEDASSGLDPLEPNCPFYMNGYACGHQDDAE